MLDPVTFLDDSGNYVHYWFIETLYEEDITEFLNENEIDASRHEVKGSIVYLLKNIDDYMALNTFLTLVS